MIPLGPKHAEYIAAHQEMWPEAMRDVSAEEWRADLAHGLSWGIERSGALVAWAIGVYESEPAVYLRDLAVLPEFQRQGLGRECFQGWLREIAARKRFPYVVVEARFTSYPIVTDASLYDGHWTLGADKVLPDFFAEYGEKGDSHRVVLMRA